jgi:hypothetical protein
MKKRIILSFFLFFLIYGTTQAFDIAGLQPLAPEGVFSTFGTESLPKGKVSAEVSLERSRETDFYRVMLKSAYGLSDNLEFIVTVPYVLDFQKSVAASKMRWGSSTGSTMKGDSALLLPMSLLPPFPRDGTNSARTEGWGSDSFSASVLAPSRAISTFSMQDPAWVISVMK